MIVLTWYGYFFTGSPNTRDLHSFPTRRSSDLRDTLLASEGVGQSVGGTCTDLAGNSASATLSNRSEEHTSELQLPYDLVCRLLLATKKVAETTHDPALLRRMEF